MPITEPDRAIILAAGPGSRLTSETGTPKPLVRVGGKTLAEHTVLALRDGAGITNFIVVTGHEADAITAHFDLIARGHDVTVDAVTATDWRFGNGASALAAREHVGDAPFFLTMTDHMFDPEIAETLARHVPEPGEMCLAVDRDKDGIFDLDDVTRVRLEDGQIQEIGKNLDAWDAADTGIMLCTSGLFEGLELAAADGLHGLSDGLRHLACQGRAKTAEVTGKFWLDVDTPEALQEAETHEKICLSKGGQRSVSEPAQLGPRYGNS